MKVKFIGEIKDPFVRKRDGELITHRLSIGLTTDEAILVSEMLKSKQNDKEPSVSLIRAILCNISTAFIDDKQLITYMAEWRTKKQLAETLSQQDYCRLFSILDNHKKAPLKEKPKETPPVKKERRVFIPEPRRR